MSETDVPISFAMRIPEGDERERRVCTTCGFIDYENPKIVVGARLSSMTNVSSPPSPLNVSSPPDA